MVNNIGLTRHQRKKVCNFIRCTAGKNSVEPHDREHAANKASLLNHVYKDQILDFEVEDKKNGKHSEKRPVVYANAEELIDVIVNERNLVGNFYVKLMIDGGQGFLKMSLTVLPENYVEEKELESQDSSKRTKYSEGGTVSKKRELISVKRVIILCIVPDVKETYNNLKKLFDLTKINNLSYKLVADFKLLLIVNGQQTASASFPCPYCFIELKSLKNFGNLQDQNDEEMASNNSNDSDEEY